MKRFFTLLGAFLLWQTMTMAQDYVKVLRGDTCLAEVPLAQLDSITLRPKGFYGSEWEYIGTGTYEFVHLFAFTKTIPIYAKEESDSLVYVKMDGWLYPEYPLIITLNPETGRCYVNPQPTGYVNGKYGMIMVADGSTYSGRDDQFISTYDEQTETFSLYIVYYVDEGYFGHGYETLKMNFEEEEEAHAASSSRKMVLPMIFDLKGKTLETKNSQTSCHHPRPADIDAVAPMQKVQPQKQQILEIGKPRRLKIKR